ncbi:MAG: CDP-alcohol phosphatidyltransferase family protein [Actinomycetota bacterium]|nr:CDP-alcohol phosphatidyltransferase family protein [Actinomycetota bacterium]
MTDAAGQPSFGPSALATPANALTVARLLGTPVFVALILARGASWITVVVGVVLAGSDGVDGWLARRQGTTRSGAFLDPLADKAVVLGAMITLAAQGRLPWAPVVLIILREVGMSAYRSWVGRRGISIPARRSAKIKTLLQDLAIATCLLPPLAHQSTLQLAFIWAAAALTVATGLQYMADGRSAARPPAAGGLGGGPS